MSELIDNCAEDTGISARDISRSVAKVNADGQVYLVLKDEDDE